MNRTLGILHALVIALTCVACSNEATPPERDLARCDAVRCERPMRQFSFELPMDAGKTCRCALPCRKDDECPAHFICNGAETTGVHAPVEGPKLACVPGTHGIEINEAVESIKEAVKPD